LTSVLFVIGTKERYDKNYKINNDEIIPFMFKSSDARFAEVRYKNTQFLSFSFMMFFIILKRHIITLNFVRMSQKSTATSSSHNIV